MSEQAIPEMEEVVLKKAAKSWRRQQIKMYIIFVSVILLLALVSVMFVTILQKVTTHGNESFWEGVPFVLVFFLELLAVAACSIPILGGPFACFFFAFYQKNRRMSLALLVQNCLKSKVSIPAVLRAWAATRFSPFYRWKLLEVAREIDNGMPLPEALVRYRQLFPPDVVRLVQIEADSTNTIALINDSFAGDDASASLYSLAMSRFVYLFILGLEFFFLGLFIIFLILPKIEEILAEFYIDINSISVFFFIMNSGIVKYMQLFFFGIALASFVLLLIKLEMFHVRPWFTRWLFHEGDSAKLLRTLSAGVQKHAPFPRILDVYQQSLRSRYLIRQCRKIVRAIDCGTNWINALRARGIITAREAIILETSQRSGNCAFMLNELALSKEAKQLRFDDLSGKLAFAQGVIFLGILLALIELSLFDPLYKLLLSLI